MDTSSIPGLELIQVADVVAREKSIEREEVMLAMEEAIQKAGRTKYGLDRDIRAMIDRKSGAITLERWIEVVEEVDQEHARQASMDCLVYHVGNVSMRVGQEEMAWRTEVERGTARRAMAAA